MRVILKGKIKSVFKGKKEIKRNKDTGGILERYYKSFFHAVDGIIYAFICEHNIIIIAVAAMITILLGFLCHIGLYEWLFCIAMIGSISASEMINTAIEATIDLISPEYHKLAKIAKDTASSATLLLCMAALSGGLLIFVPKIIILFY